MRGLEGEGEGGGGKEGEEYPKKNVGENIGGRNSVLSISGALQEYWRENT